jgi:chromosomal replication initiation ATPase DnaA
VDSGPSKAYLVKKKNQSSLQYALEYIQLGKELENYKIYNFLKIEVARKYNVSIQFMESSKDYRMVEARMILFALIKRYTSYNYRMIAYLFNVKNHSKIHHAVRLICSYESRNLYRNSILKRLQDLELELPGPYFPALATSL